MADNPYLVAPGDGRTVRLHDLVIRHTVDGQHTHGAFSIVEHVIQPKVLVKPHRHTREDEVSIVVRGTVSVRVGALEFQGSSSDVIPPAVVASTNLPFLPHPYLQEGQQVRITAGPLEGVEGILVHMKPNKGLLVLSVELLQRSVAVEVDCTHVVIR